MKVPTVMMKQSYLALALVVPTYAGADIDIRFREGAPTDRFIVTNTAPCIASEITLTIDLQPSAGALFFDITADGAGVEVFQPVTLVQGHRSNITTNTISDGDQILTIKIDRLFAGDVIALTADLDDQLTDGDFGQIRVSGAEIEGAAVSAQIGGLRAVAKFSTNAQANLITAACAS